MKKMRNLVAAGMAAVSLAAGASNVMACAHYCQVCGSYLYANDYYTNDCYNYDYSYDYGNTYSYNTGSYILPYSDSAYYTSADLAGLSNVELLIARNEIYARRGRLFNDQSIQRYFNAQGWYYGYISPSSFSENVFNSCEQANVDLILAEERARGKGTVAQREKGCRGCSRKGSG
jgi:hypothetical protein